MTVDVDVVVDGDGDVNESRNAGGDRPDGMPLNFAEAAGRNSDADASRHYVLAVLDERRHAHGIRHGVASGRAERPMEARPLETAVGDTRRPSRYNGGMEPRLNFVTLVVADLDRARRFYVDGLGWKAALTGDDVLMIHVGQKLVLSLWSEAGAREEIGEVTRSGTLPFTLAHNVATPAEVDAVLATARAAGAAVHDGRQRAWGGYSGYFVDPEGFRWEVAFNPHPIPPAFLFVGHGPMVSSRRHVPAANRPRARG